MLTTQEQTSTAAQTETDKLTRISSTGQEANTDKKDEPVSATPTGETSGGVVASPTLEIPSNPVPVDGSW